MNLSLNSIVSLNVDLHLYRLMMGDVKINRFVAGTTAESDITFGIFKPVSVYHVVVSPSQPKCSSRRGCFERKMPLLKWTFGAPSV